jgi:hypothetical protein
MFPGDDARPPGGGLELKQTETGSFGLWPLARPKPSIDRPR